MGIDRESTPETEELAALRSIVEGTADGTGEEFFHSLVRHLTSALKVNYALVAEFAGPKLRARTLAYWKIDRIAENFEWELAGTPCEDVITGGLCHHPMRVAEKFPADKALTRMGIQSYLGVPLKDAAGNVLGHLAVFDTNPMPDEPRKLYTFRIFAARAAAELERLRFERALADGEKRFRDLYEQAPIAYIYEDTQSVFVNANHAACKLLGIKPEEIKGTVGLSLIADTPENKARVAKALEAINQGKEQTCIELELRRKDDGRPVWVQWWSKPEPDGKHTRTMIIDITDRVLMEQEKARLQQQNLYLQEEIKAVHNFEEIVGQSPALVSVLENVRRVAPAHTSVLITGETGTGKELIARAIHSVSQREDKPLIKVNCAALPTGLVESELFGHEKGAFSGAIARRIGRFELANGGTIFLDEIGEIPLEVQVKLLRVLQEREFERVGGTASIRCDVRVIAATNRDLLKCVREGTFREDLYYRLNVFPIQLPPLRQREDDIPLLATFLINKFAARIGKHIQGVSKETMQLLKRYSWPGNIRELENILERAVILATSPIVEIDPDVLPETAVAEPVQPSSETGLDDLERNHIIAILKQTNWVIEGNRGAARILKIHPNTLRSRLKKMGISRSSHETS